MLDAVAPPSLGTIKRCLHHVSRFRLGSIDIANPTLTITTNVFAPIPRVVASEVDRIRPATASPSSSDAWGQRVANSSRPSLPNKSSERSRSVSLRRGPSYCRILVTEGIRRQLELAV